MKRLYGIRGAVCTENTKKDIQLNVQDVCKKLFQENALVSENIVSIQFSITNDITVLNPAAALRRSDCGIDVSDCALFCCQEAFIENYLPKTIRILVTAYLEDGSKPCHSYLNGAEVLRPDFIKR